MKSLLILLGSLILITTANVCGFGVCRANAACKVVKHSSLISSEGPKTVTLKITGMSCAGCANHIHTALLKLGGVISDEVKFPGDIAIVKYDATRVSEEQIVKVIEEAGYKAEVQKERKGEKKQA